MKSRITQYHGTTHEFETLRPSGAGNIVGGIYFTSDKNLAYRYANELKTGTPRIIESNLDIKNPAPHEIVNNLIREKKCGFEAMNELKKQGYDSVIGYGIGEGSIGEVVVFNQSQLTNTKEA